MSKLLIFGDIVGRPGRSGLAQVLPIWREEYGPDLVLANVENLAHGKGVTPKTLAEMDALGFDAYTSGNHVMDQKDLSRECFDSRRNLIRPANYMGAWPGQGCARLEKKGMNFLIINLNGKVFFDEEKFGGIKNPFWTVDEILSKVAREGDIIIIDFHAEATSEKAALGWHLDGRVAFVYGTHSHVPTADERILPDGTGFVTDIGMTGPINSVIGAKKEIALESYLDHQKRFKMEVPENGPVAVRAILAELDSFGKLKSLKRLESFF